MILTVLGGEFNIKTFFQLSDQLIETLDKWVLRRLINSG